MRYVDTHVSTGTSLLNVGTSQEDPGLKKLAKVGGRSTIGYQNHHQVENRDSHEMTKSEPGIQSELKRNVTPQHSEIKTYRKKSKIRQLRHG